ncbi:hypothetical protein KVR01_012295 [Diaporthe batatas]|uniref:uncharacterized protein n=1 Tax=Diaporthe batatas TaxID=748121 RepID=UPI001D03A113|nr:uncharacterized protein KVR01_012295 [Diaporthe batatas]KAG8158023.1 hypothetical protein KVR01_012295 [Diaporthe batatas]
MARFSTLIFFALASVATPVWARPSSQVSPVVTVTVQGGSYSGTYNAAYGQDLFLGMPYAQPPTGDLRFRPPQPLNATWTGVREATDYSPQCFGYGSDTWVLGNHVSEDCLTINVVRPHGVQVGAKLPVALWIHGGGLTQGGGSDPRYNTSFIVQQSVEMGTPMIVASINYRLHAWGFLWSDEVQADGAGNLGYRDQRAAMEWLRDNAAAFGGDPDQVTIWGESAGARSVSAQILAYGGRDDKLFRAAIMQSGTGYETDFGEVPTQGISSQDYYNTLVNKTNCTAAADTLQCLRQVPSWDLSDILNATSTPAFANVIDGDFLQAPRWQLVRDGKFVHVPVIIGNNFDEGAAFGTKGINTTAQWEALLRSGGAGNDTVAALSALYPDDPAVGIPATLDGRPTGDLAYYGAQWKRVAAFTGDRGYVAPRRAWAESWAAAGLTAYSYGFDVLVNGMSPAVGATHFQEVAFVFDNTAGLGYQNAVAVNPFEGRPETYPRLADLMSRMWVAFITGLDPNAHGVDGAGVEWPPYELDRPTNIVFDTNVTALAYQQADDYREEAMDYLKQKLWS